MATPGGSRGVLVLSSVWLLCSVSAPGGDALSASTSTTSSVFALDSPVVELDPASFDLQVLRSLDWWIVAWYHPRCGHCQLLRGEYAEASARAKAGGLPVHFGAINCQQHVSLAFEHRIMYYPSLRLYGANKSRVIEYEGWRSSHGIHAAVASFAAGNGTSITLRNSDYVMHGLKTISLHYRMVSSCFLLLLLLATFFLISDTSCRAFGRFLFHELGLRSERWGPRGRPMLPVSSCDGLKCGCTGSSPSKAGSCCGVRNAFGSTHDH